MLGVTSTAEALCDSLYQHTGYSPDAPPTAIPIAKACFGPDFIRLVPKTWGRRGHPGISAARIDTESGEVRVLLPRGMHPRRAHWQVSYRVARWWMRRNGYVFGCGAESAEADSISEILAAAIVAPRRAFLASLLRHDGDLAALARAWCLEESSIALRIAEATRQVDAAVVDRDHVRVRLAIGRLPEDEGELRRLVALPVLPRGFVRVRLADDPTRVAMLAGRAA